MLIFLYMIIYSNKTCELEPGWFKFVIDYLKVDQTIFNPSSKKASISKEQS